MKVKVFKILLHGVPTGEYYYTELTANEAVRLLNSQYGSKAYRVNLGFMEAR